MHTLGSNGTGTVKWWVGAEFAVHHDMKSHTNGMVSMLRVALYSYSSKQKLNTKILNEAELVGMDDIMSQILPHLRCTTT